MLVGKMRAHKNVREHIVGGSMHGVKCDVCGIEEWSTGDDLLTDGNCIYCTGKHNKNK